MSICNYSNIPTTYIPERRRPHPSPFNLMTGSRSRLYMGLYKRTRGQGYHMALLLSPKSPTDSVAIWRYHATNKPNPETPVTQQDWVYEPMQVFGRDSRLLALVLLDKTGRCGEDLARVLASAPVVQSDPNWNCRSWLFGAVQHLVNRGFMTPTPVPVEQLHSIAATLADDFGKLPAEERERSPIPTCDSAGQKIRSEMV
ncbi:hypothetical protein B0H21DRAFT_539205 [Amylocystis lapponica]|nr:hypothetical protein B0H21DRAFT_539205 [Amylocystis lapponica]